jgi:hypothetical protein
MTFPVSQDGLLRLFLAGCSVELLSEVAGKPRLEIEAAIREALGDRERKAGQGETH